MCVPQRIYNEMLSTANTSSNVVEKLTLNTLYHLKTPECNTRM